MFQVTGLNCLFMAISLQKKLMKMDTATEILTMKYKDKKQYNKKFIVLKKYLLIISNNGNMLRQL